MFWRLVTLVLFQSCSAGLGWFVATPGAERITALVYSLLGGLVWFAMDCMRGLRMLRWLREGAASELTLGNGLWGEAHDRVRRLQRAGNRLAQESDNRLEDFLAALQASPNGVVLLDVNSRIEWFNQTAAEHFGFDPQRDMLQHIGNLVRDPGFAAYLAARNFLHDVTMPGRDSKASKPIKLSVHLHPYGDGRVLLLSPTFHWAFWPASRRP